MEIIEYKKEMETDVQTYVSSLPKTIENNETFLIFGAELKINKSKQKTIDDRLDPEKKKARAAWQSWVDLIDELKAPLIKMEQHYKTEISRYAAEQEKIRRVEEARLQEVARKEEEDRRLKEAVMLEKAGDMNAVNDILDEPVYVPPVVVLKSVPKVAGISFRENWDFEITNVNLIPRQYLEPNMTAIRSVVKGLKAQTNIPGIRVFATSNVSAGRAA